MTRLRRAAPYAGVGAASFVANIVIAAMVGWPFPSVHDEFSYLLAGDTFAHGRLANPMHTMWRYFETPHTLVRPSYASKYPPAQGLFLAVGQVVTGRPIIGVWLSVALAGMAVYWMMLAFVRPKLAACLAVLAVLHPTVLAWGQSYWGGAIALGGAALTLGALGRIWHEPCKRDVALLAVGITVLFNSRPFEGTVLVALLGLLSLAIVVRRGRAFAGELKRASLPLVVIGAAAVLFTMTYNHAVTGSVVTMPYSEHAGQYLSAGLFVFEEARTDVTYNNEQLAELARWELDSHSGQRSLSGFASAAESKVRDFVGDVDGALWVLLGFVGLPAAVRRRELFGGLLVVALGALAVLMIETWYFSHYGAPLIALVFLLAAIGVERLATWQWRDIRVGALLTAAAVVLAPLGIYWSVQLGEDWRRSSNWALEREALADDLRARSGDHLVIVRHGPDHSVHQEWVQNGADIDGSKVVWARELNDEQPLLDYFKDRTVWLVEPEVDPTRLVPYSPPVNS